MVGAGLAGLVAARDLVDAGVSTFVLEARDRVGGRLLSETGSSGVTVDLGGQWVSPEHERVRALADDLGVELTPAPAVGRATATIGGREVEMRGALPAAGALARIDLSQAGYRLGRLVAATALGDPAAGAGMARRDEITAATWLERNLHTSAGRKIARAMVELCFAFTPEETSLLGLLFDIRAARSISGVLDAQADIVVGGTQQLAIRLAEQLGDRVVTEAAVDRVSWSHEGVEVCADRRTWTANAAAICIPPALARRIEFAPALPEDRRALLDGMIPGNAIKALAVYETPFWRQLGHSGSTFNVGSPLVVTADVSPPDGKAGVLVALACASGADSLRRTPPEKREGAVLSSLVELFGEHAREAREVFVRDWSEEPFTGGCYAGHFTPGTLTAAGAGLREPCGPIHWGGTETATECEAATELRRWIRGLGDGDDIPTVLNGLRRRTEELYDRTIAYVTVHALVGGARARLDVAAVDATGDARTRLDAIGALFELIDMDAAVFQAVNRSDAGRTVAAAKAARDAAAKIHADLGGVADPLARELHAEATVLETYYRGLLRAATLVEAHERGLQRHQRSGERHVGSGACLSTASYVRYRMADIDAARYAPPSVVANCRSRLSAWVDVLEAMAKALALDTDDRVLSMSSVQLVYCYLPRAAGSSGWWA